MEPTTTTIPFCWDLVRSYHFKNSLSDGQVVTTLLQRTLKHIHPYTHAQSESLRTPRKRNLEARQFEQQIINQLVF